VVYLDHEDKKKVEAIATELAKGDDCKLFESILPNPAGEWDYDWCVSNWGTKWDASVYDYHFEEDGRLYISFDTAWAPPTAILDYLYHNGYDVEAFYREEGMAFAGWYIDGEDNLYEYANMTADEIDEQLPTELNEMFNIAGYIRDCEAEEEYDDIDMEEALQELKDEFDAMMSEEKDEKDAFADDSGREWLKKLLHERVVGVTFTKKDGTERVMQATLSEKYIPQAERGEDKSVTRKKSEEALAVWDTEVQGWRSFRWDSVKSVNFSLGE
jgi:translation elongation factor EF-G